MGAGSESVDVVVRCRGRTTKEVSAKAAIAVSKTGENQVSVNNSGDSSLASQISSKVYTVDQVFDPSTDQATIFHRVAKPLFKQFTQGYNVTIFAYGQTGTGKTYTMCGDERIVDGMPGSEAGIIPRVLFELFQEFEENDATKGMDFAVKCSFMELYNEELRDLLNTDTRSSRVRIFEQRPSPLGVSDSSNKGVIHIDGIEEAYISSPLEGLDLLHKGISKRMTASTKMNDTSSRSHTIFTINLFRKEATGEYRVAKMNLVDLAGSENVARSGATSIRAKEAGSINQSLLTLGRVINALVDKQNYVPYRESKLTRILQDSLGGKTKTALIANVAPSSLDFQETISTLEYASKAKNIKNTAQTGTLVMREVLLRDFALEMAKMKQDLIATRSKEGVFMSESNHKELMLNYENYKSQVDELSRGKQHLAEENKILRAGVADEKFKKRQSQKASQLKDQQIEQLSNHLKKKEAEKVNAETLLGNLVQSLEKDFKHLQNAKAQSELFLRKDVGSVVENLLIRLSELVTDVEEHSSLRNSVTEIKNLATEIKSQVESTKQDITANVLDPISGMDRKIEVIVRQVQQTRDLAQEFVTESKDKADSILSANTDFDAFISGRFFENQNESVKVHKSQQDELVSTAVSCFQQEIEGYLQTFSTSLRQSLSSSFDNGMGATIDHNLSSLRQRRASWNEKVIKEAVIFEAPLKSLQDLTHQTIGELQDVNKQRGVSLKKLQESNDSSSKRVGELCKRQLDYLMTVENDVEIGARAGKLSRTALNEIEKQLEGTRANIDKHILEASLKEPDYKKMEELLVVPPLLPSSPTRFVEEKENVNRKRKLETNTSHTRPKLRPTALPRHPARKPFTEAKNRV